MEHEQKLALIRAAVENHLGDFAYYETDEVKIKLGRTFENAVWKFLDRTGKWRDAFEGEFTEMSQEELEYYGSPQSRKADATISEGIRDLREAAFREIGKVHRYFLIAIGFYPQYLPDYEVWSMRDSFEPSELKWLSIGFCPTHQLITGNATYPDKGEKRDELLEREAEIRRGIIERSTKLQSYGQLSVKATSAFEWVQSIDLAVPNGFRAMLRKASGRLNGQFEKTFTGDYEAPSKDDPRSVRTISKILVAMAVDGYGWRPDDLRSPIPGEIEAVCDRLGVGVTRETVLKYLRMGASQMPKIDGD